MNPQPPDQVVIISDFSQVQGGASKLAVTQAERLAARGIPVTFFCGDRAGTLPSGVVPLALDGRRLLETSKLSAALNGLWNRNAQHALGAWVKRYDTKRTIYHVHGYHQTLSPAVLAPLRGVRDRVVMHAHDYFLGCPNGAFFDFRSATTCTRRPMSGSCLARNCDKRSYAQKLWRVSRQAIQNKARARLCPDLTTILIHDGMAGYLFPDGADGHISVVPNPTSPLLDVPVMAEANSDIVYVGDIHRYKGVELLAQAGRQAGIQIRYVGSGQDLETLKATYPEHRFDGWQDRDGLRQILAQARLVVSPTLGPEPFGLAPVEALLSGIPVLLSDSMLLAPQIVADGMGEAFEAGERSALTACLERLAQDDALIAQLSRRAQEKSHTLTLGVEEWADALLLIYGGIFDRQAATGETLDPQ